MGSLYLIVLSTFRNKWKAHFGRSGDADLVLGSSLSGATFDKVLLNSHVKRSELTVPELQPKTFAMTSQADGSERIPENLKDSVDNSGKSEDTVKQNEVAQSAFGAVVSLINSVMKI